MWMTAAAELGPDQWFPKVMPFSWEQVIYTKGRKSCGASARTLSADDCPWQDLCRHKNGAVIPAPFAESKETGKP